MKSIIKRVNKGSTPNKSGNISYRIELTNGEVVYQTNKQLASALIYNPLALAGCAVEYEYWKKGESQIIGRGTDARTVEITTDNTILKTFIVEHTSLSMQQQGYSMALREDFAEQRKQNVSFSGGMNTPTEDPKKEEPKAGDFVKPIGAMAGEPPIDEEA